jgi:hypothetical protein
MADSARLSWGRVSPRIYKHRDVRRVGTGRPARSGVAKSSSQCDSPRPSMTRVLMHNRRSLRRSRGGELTGRDSTLASRAPDL